MGWGEVETTLRYNVHEDGLIHDLSVRSQAFLRITSQINDFIPLQ